MAIALIQPTSPATADWDANGFYVKNAGIPCAQVLHKNGSLTSYPAAANTDVAAGTAITAARTAAVSGDTIYVYRNASVTSNLAKDGVNWWFAPGVVITNTAHATIFGDSSGQATSFTVGGDGSFIGNALLADGVSGPAGAVVSVVNAASVVNIRCRKIYCQTAAVGGGQPYGIYQELGSLTVQATEQIYGDSFAIWWQDGSCFVETPVLQSGPWPSYTATIYTTNATASHGDLFVRCQRMVSQAGLIVNADSVSSGTLGRIWVDAMLMVSSVDQPSINYSPLQLSGAMLVYVKCEKFFVSGDRNGLPAFYIKGDAQLWFQALKFSPNQDSSNGAAPIYFDAGTTGTNLWIDVQQYDDSAGSVGPAFVDLAAGPSNLYLHGGAMLLRARCGRHLGRSCVMQRLPRRSEDQHPGR